MRRVNRVLNRLVVDEGSPAWGGGGDVVSVVDKAVCEERAKCNNKDSEGKCVCARGREREMLVGCAILGNGRVG